jgi:Fanconi anemia group J protein
VLLSVVRGRASEGVNFSDDAVRCCFVVGVPLLPFGDVAVVAKKAFNDAHRGSGLPSGQVWSDQEAVRATAQALGRVVRHAADFGAVVLLDCRYAARARGSVHALLPAYLHRQVPLREAASPQAAAALLPPFFARCAASAAAAATAAAAAAAAAAAVKREGVKREG